MTRPLKEMKNFLKEVPIFSELDDQALDFLAKKASEKTYPRDSIIIRRREWGTSLLILRSGEVKVILEKKTGGEVTLSTLKKGDFFGELSLLDGKARSATVIAMEDSTIVEIEKEVLKEMFKSSGFSFKFLEEIAGRFRNTDDSIRKFADRVCSDAYTSLDEILKSQLESAKIFF